MFSQFSEPIHNYFGLSYAQYLTLPRSVLQSMPQEWQAKFTDLLEEIPATLDVSDMPSYKIKSVDEKGRTINDPYRDYERGRRKIPSK